MVRYSDFTLPLPSFETGHLALFMSALNTWPYGQSVVAERMEMIELYIYSRRCVALFLVMKHTVALSPSLHSDLWHQGGGPKDWSMHFACRSPGFDPPPTSHSAPQKQAGSGQEINKKLFFPLWKLIVYIFKLI